MPISLRCQCGEPLRARDESADTCIKCPTCGNVVTVHSSKSVTDDIPWVLPAEPTASHVVVLSAALGMKFAWIAPGTFFMGSPESEEGRPSEATHYPVSGYEEAQHKVTLTKGFYMGVHLVTQEQWQLVMGNNPSRFEGQMNLPVESVSREDCQEFIKRLRDMDEKPYRLPTEAEWEYACRAGTTTPFYFGETISAEQANYQGDMIYGNGKTGKYRETTTPVGEFPPNAFGLYDMHGNVWEWCEDWFGDYPQNDEVDPQGPNAGECGVLRGGSWIDEPQLCRSAYRRSDKPYRCWPVLGCRLCFSDPDDPLIRAEFGKSQADRREGDRIQRSRERSRERARRAVRTALWLSGPLLVFYCLWGLVRGLYEDSPFTTAYGNLGILGLGVLVGLAETILFPITIPVFLIAVPIAWISG